MTQLRAATMANRLKFARLAFRMSDGFFRGEAVPRLPTGYFGPRTHVNVPRLPTLLDEEIARIDAAIVLDHSVAIARLMQGARIGLVACERFGDVVKEPNAGFPALRPPQIEGLTEEWVDWGRFKTGVGGPHNVSVWSVSVKSKKKHLRNFVFARLAAL